MKAINPFAILDVEEQQAAAERMAEINYAYGVLTDRAKAAAHKRTIDQIRAAGHHVPNPPRREQPDPPPRPSGGDANYRTAASSEFAVPNGKAGTPWTARPRRRRWFSRS